MRIKSAKENLKVLTTQQKHLQCGDGYVLHLSHTHTSLIYHIYIFINRIFSSVGLPARIFKWSR